MDDPPIVLVIHRYYPDWDPPKDTGRTWAPCLCPFHAESRPSASVSFEHNAFRCHGCGLKGDVIALIKNQEGVSHSEALRISEEISPGGHVEVPQEPPRQSSRRVFGDQGAQRPQRLGRDQQVPSRVRGRSTPWA